MSALIPALIAALFAEFGGRARSLIQAPHALTASLLLGLLVGAAAVAGGGTAPLMTAHARALMLGLALIISGAGQLRSASTQSLPMTLFATLRIIGQSSAPFLAFSFAIWRAAPVDAAIGTLMGLAGAVALSSLSISAAITTWLRWFAGVTLATAGCYAVLSALRLIA